MTSIETLYLTLLAGDAPAPELQRRIMCWARQTNTDSVLVALTKHCSLEREIDDLLGGINRPAVLAAWLTKPGRATHHITARLNTKIPVSLRRKLAETELPIEALELLATDTDPRTAAALLANPNSTEELRQHVFAHAAAGWDSLKVSQREAVLIAVYTSATASEAFMRACSSFAAMRVGLLPDRNDYSRAALDNAVRLLITELRGAAADIPKSAEGTSLGRMSDIDIVIARLLTQQNLREHDVRRLPEALEHCVSATSLAIIQMGYEALAERCKTFALLLCEAPAISDPERLDAIATAAIEHRLAGIAHLVATNPATHDRTLCRVARWVRTDVLVAICGSRRDDALTAALIAELPTLAGALLPISSDPDSVVAQALVTANAFKKETIVGNAERISTAILRELPIGLMGNRGRPSGRSSLAQPIGTQLSVELSGMDATTLDAFETLIAASPDDLTFGALMDQVRAVTAT